MQIAVKYFAITIETPTCVFGTGEMVNPKAVVMCTTNRRAAFTTHRTIQRFAPWDNIG